MLLYVFKCSVCFLFAEKQLMFVYFWNPEVLLKSNNLSNFFLLLCLYNYIAWLIFFLSIPVFFLSNSLTRTSNPVLNSDSSASSPGFQTQRENFQYIIIKCDVRSRDFYRFFSFDQNSPRFPVCLEFFFKSWMYSKY